MGSSSTISRFFGFPIRIWSYYNTTTCAKPLAYFSEKPTRSQRNTTAGREKSHRGGNKRRPHEGVKKQRSVDS